MRNKKATAETIVKWAIALLILVVVVTILMRPSAPAFAAVSKTALKAQNDICKSKGEKFIREGKKAPDDFDDRDNDKYPDDCDVCIVGDKGDNSKDRDDDGMPDDCDELSQGTDADTKYGCKGSGWDRDARKKGKCIK